MFDTGSVLSVAGWIGLTVLLGFAGIFVVRRVRIWTQAEGETDSFTLQDLRDMHARGDIGETEFETMRAELISGISPSRSRDGPEGSKNNPAPPEAP